MATSDKEFLIRVRADIQQALAQLKKLPPEVGRTADASQRSARGIDGMGRGLQFLTRAAGAYLSINFAVRLIRQADAWNTLQTRIRTATRDTGDYNTVQRELLDITQKNGQQLDTTVSLFQSLARSAPELQASNKEILTLVDAVQQLGVISGASQASLSAGLLQFSQGLASGVFRAEEFNSLLENLPEVASRIAKGLGVSVGELRKMVINGQLLSKDVFNSLLGQSEDIAAQFAEIPDTVARSATRLSTSFTRMLSVLDKASGTTNFTAQLLQGIAEQFDNIAVSLGDDEIAKLNRDLKEAKALLTDYRAAFLSETGEAITGVKRQIAELEQQLKTAKGVIDRIGFTGRAVHANAPPPAANPEQTNVDRVIAALQAEADTYGQTREQVALYKLEQLGASEAELTVARALAATTAAKQAHDDVMEAGRQVYAATRTDIEKMVIEHERLNALYKQGAFGAVGSAEALETLRRALEKAVPEFEKLSKKGEETNERLIAATKGWGDQFTNTLADMVQQGKLDFSSLADSIIRDLLRIAIYQNITAPLFSSLGVKGFHGGGIVGGGGSFTRNVNPLLFAGAPHYHGGGFAGLSPGEVPAILQTGELVLSRDQVASMGGGGNIRIQVDNRGTPGQVTDASFGADSHGTVISIVMDDIQRGGPLRNLVKTVSKG